MWVAKAALQATGRVIGDQVTWVDTGATTITGAATLNGAAYEQDFGAVIVTTEAVAASDTFIGGFRYRSDGALRVIDATAGVPAGSNTNQGFALNSDGRLCYVIGSGTTFHMNGVPVDGSRRVYAAPLAFALEFADLGAGAVDTAEAITNATPTFTRAGATAWTRNSSGAWIGPIAANVARSYYSAAGVYLGYLAEGARTNHFLNSAAPVTQTSPSLSTGNHTLWMEGSGSVEVSANSATITGAGTATDGNPVTFNVTGAGTVDYTVTGSPDRVQAEAGAFASSYIETAGASVTRNADVLTYPTTGWLSASAGTLYAEAQTLGSLAATEIVFGMNDGTTNERLGRMGFNGANGLFSGFDGGVLQWGIQTSGGVTAATSIKLAGAYAVNDFAFSMDGGTVGTDTSGTLPTVTQAQIGSDATGASPLFGPIRRVAYYAARLANATLQGLTT